MNTITTQSEMRQILFKLSIIKELTKDSVVKSEVEETMELVRPLTKESKPQGEQLYYDLYKITIDRNAKYSALVGGLLGRLKLLKSMTTDSAILPEIDFAIKNTEEEIASMNEVSIKK